ncbi:galactoside 2-alpha-L-fucosyltransferase 2-like [Centruroides sculpturatus]|uniref:galactoside 2-alpha-L-fucosyltransferase 2-like n=1 Tax=Centruroides sculpturatus TaxID=218467 RepID=UPI000C6EAAF7|nr:galactoside 2-alpha-L-fucosyltransferase 2-like [Centruroides sculpturatus]
MHGSYLSLLARIFKTTEKFFFRRSRLLTAAFITGLLFLGWLFVHSTNNWYQWYHIKQDAFQDPSFLTIYCNPGRLGNQMSTYAALLGLSKLNNRTPYAQHCNMIHLRPYFYVSAAEIQEIPKNKRRDYPLAPYFRPEDSHIPTDKSVLSGYGFPNSYTFFDHIRNIIRREFQFKEFLVSYVQTFLLTLREQKPKALFVGVHVRRTDYCKWLKKYSGRKVNLLYFNEAFKYFRNKYSNVIFIVVSDDRRWCRKYLTKWSDVVVAPTPPEAAYDLALLSQCNHTIITYGTFGFWGAYLAGGDTVYFAEYLMPNSTFLTDHLPYNKTYLPEWIGITAKNNKVSNRFEEKDKLCDLPWYQIFWDWLWYS